MIVNQFVKPILKFLVRKSDYIVCTTVKKKAPPPVLIALYPLVPWLSTQVVDREK